jgi:iron complex transport system substrate-binding protein
VGVSEHSDFPEPARTLPRVGGFSRPNPETILALRPDLLVVSPAPENRETVDLLRARDIPVLVIEARGLEEIGPALLALGEELAAAGAARGLAASIDARLAGLAELVRERPRPGTLLVIQPEPLIVCGPESYPGSLLRLAGGENLVPPGDSRYPGYSLEVVLRSAPEVLVETAMVPAEGEESLAARQATLARWSRFPQVPAVRDGRVHRLESDALLRPGPRAPEGVADLIALLHPELAAEARRLSRDPDFPPAGPREG